MVRTTTPSGFSFNVGLRPLLFITTRYLTNGMRSRAPWKQHIEGKCVLGHKTNERNPLHQACTVSRNISVITNGSMWGARPECPEIFPQLCPQRDELGNFSSFAIYILALLRSPGLLQQYLFFWIFFFWQLNATIQIFLVSGMVICAGICKHIPNGYQHYF